MSLFKININNESSNGQLDKCKHNKLKNERRDVSETFKRSIKN